MMKNFWSKLAIALCAVIFCLVLSSCEKEEQTAQATRLVIKTPMQELNAISSQKIRNVPDFLSAAAAAFALERPGIKPEVVVFNYVDEIKAVTDTFGTAHAPDILFGAFFNLTGYVDTGRVAPLDDMIDENLRNDIAQEGWSVSQREGRTYLMPFLSMQNILIYNKNLFRECGLEKYIGTGYAIQTWTLPEWKTILDTLAKRLPKGIYPLAIFAKNNQGDTHILSYLRAFGGPIFNEKGDFDFQDPRIVKALGWLQEGVRRGWFPPHPENLEMKDCSELFANGQLAIYMFNNANRALYTNLANYGFVNYPSGIATRFYNGFAVFDNGDPGKLAAAKDFIRFIYDNDKWRDLSAGNIPVSQRTLKKYMDKITMLKEFQANIPNEVDFVNASPNWQGRQDSFRSVFWPNIHRLLALEITPEQCAMDLDKACNEALRIGREQRKLHL